MDTEPTLETGIDVPRVGYSLSVRLRPSPIRTTALRLLPWALYIAIPRSGRMSKISYGLAQKFSPLMKQKVKGL